MAAPLFALGLPAFFKLRFRAGGVGGSSERFAPLADNESRTAENDPASQASEEDPPTPPAPSPCLKSALTQTAVLTIADVQPNQLVAAAA